MDKKKGRMNVRIAPGCIACGLCEQIAPAVFQIADRSYVVRDAAIAKYKEEVKQAAELCPVQVIEIVKEDDEAVE